MQTSVNLLRNSVISSDGYSAFVEISFYTFNILFVCYAGTFIFKNTVDICQDEM